MSVPAQRLERVFRSMTEEHLAQVQEIERASYDFPWERANFQDCLLTGHICWVLESASGVDAYGIVSLEGRDAHLLNLCVHPAQRRQRLGQVMLLHLMSLASRCGIGRILLEVRPSNLPARRLYDRLHFRCVGRRRDYYSAVAGSEDALVLMRRLQSRTALSAVPDP